MHRFRASASPKVVFVPNIREAHRERNAKVVGQLLRCLRALLTDANG